ncbi:MAG: dihydrodipicolinate synthase family protein [Victivallales bacterium]|nr:dihydrodipicolinate synthase family protein [Victivallales bacterium]
MDDNQIFKGVFSALVTPLDKAGNLNCAAVADLIEYQLAAGLHGFYLCGGTGEGPALSPDIRRKMVECAIQANRGRGKIIVQVGGSVRADEAFALAEHAAQCGADGLSSVPPSLYYQYSEDDTVGYYQELARRTPLPILVYRTASFAGATMMSLMSRLLQAPNIIGLKYTGVNYYELWKLTTVNGGNINVVNGADETLLCGLVSGAQAGIGALYNVIPGEFAGLYRAFQAGDVENARRHQRNICASVATLGRFVRSEGIIPPLKALMESRGLPAGHPVYPATALPQEQREQLASTFEETQRHFEQEQ